MAGTPPHSAWAGASCFEPSHPPQRRLMGETPIADDMLTLSRHRPSQYLKRVQYNAYNTRAPTVLCFLRLRPIYKSSRSPTHIIPPQRPHTETRQASSGPSDRPEESCAAITRLGHMDAVRMQEPSALFFTQLHRRPPHTARDRLRVPAVYPRLANRALLAF